MFDIAPTELLVLGAVAIMVIPPKDLPRAMRFAGHWVGKARGVARQFRSGFDAMVREAELAEMEKRWKEENERILREHPLLPSEPHPPVKATATSEEALAPVMVEKPVVAPASELDPAHEPERASQGDRAAS